MTLSCGSKVLKYMLFFTNGIVCAASVFFLIVAIRGLASDVFPKGFPSTPERFEFSVGSSFFANLCHEFFNSYLFATNLFFLACFSLS